jgi:hypothetical protein
VKVALRVRGEVFKFNQEGPDLMHTKFSSLFHKTALACAFTATALLGSSVASAADTPAATQGVRGEITALDGNDLKVHTSRGEDLTVHLSDDVKVRAVTLGSIDEIKQGSYIGTAAIPQPDGSLKALEVHVFPPALAGTGDGHRAFDLTKDSTMTNGSVGDLKVANGRTLTYKGGEKKVYVPEDVPIVNLLPGDRSLLKPGVKIVLSAQKAEDGSLSAKFVSAGKDGVKPPM